jgi:hypothetical protein
MRPASAVLRSLCVACLVAGCHTPPQAPTIPPPASPPALKSTFQSTSGRTIIKYYSYDSGTCGTGAACGFRGLIDAPRGFAQAEVFLSGFVLEGQVKTDTLEHASAQVQKFRYDAASGEFEVGVSGQLSTGSRQPYAYSVTFAAIFTDATAAKFTRVGNGCTGVGRCNVVRAYPGAVPPNMQYIGLGSRLFDLGSNSGPVLVNVLSAHIDSITVNPPNVNLDYLCSLQNASGTNRMFCEWDASIIAFDPAEMDRNNSTLFPQSTFLVNGTSVAQRYSGQAQTPMGATIRGSFDALEGVTFLYGSGQEHAIWLVESSASNVRISGSPASTATTDYGIFLGTTFGDRTNASVYGLQESRSLGLLK